MYTQPLYCIYLCIRVVEACHMAPGVLSHTHHRVRQPGVDVQSETAPSTIHGLCLLQIILCPTHKPDERECTLICRYIHTICCRMSINVYIHCTCEVIEYS